MPPHESRFPDDAARTEQGAVSTQFDPHTGRRLKTGAVIAAAVLLLGFIIVGVIRFLDGRALGSAEEKAYLAPPPVDVVVARPASTGQDLVLPGGRRLGTTRPSTRESTAMSRSGPWT